MPGPSRVWSDYPLNVITPTQSDASGRITPTTGVTQDTYGSWVEVVASASGKVVAILVTIAAGFPEDIQFRIGTGPGGSEVVKIQDVGVESSTTTVRLKTYLIPFLILAGVRVAVAVVNRTNTTDRSIPMTVNLLEE